MASQRRSASPPPPAAKGSYHTLSTAIPIRTSFVTLTLRTVTLVALWLPRVSSKGSLQFDAMAVTSHPFRPGSGALVSQPSSQARAAALSAGHLPEPLLVKAGGLPEPPSVKADPGSTPGPAPALSTYKDTPLLSVRSTATAAAAALSLLGVAAVGTMMHRHRDGGNHHAGGHRPLGSAHIPAHHIGKVPPAYDPRFEDKYSFRQYMREMQHWVLVTDLPPHQQAVMTLRNLGGAAYDLISQLPPSELYAGATVNGVHMDPVSNILLKLHHRFAQQDIVTRMSAMSEMLNFRRYDREGISSTLTRFEVIRHRAASEGQFVMTIEGYAVMLMRECRLNKQHVHNLLLPFQGNFPSNEDQFQTLVEGIKRIGLLNDDGPNTVGQLLGGGHSRQSFLGDTEDSKEDTGASSSTEQTTNVFTTWSWEPQQQEGSSSWSFPAAHQEDTDSSSATSSDDGHMDETMSIPGIDGMTEQEAHEHVYYQYRNAKRNWRRLTGRPVRRFRRTFKKSKGRGRGFSRQKRGKGFWFSEPVLTFLSSKGKGDRKGSTGKGFGRQGNPRDRNGEIMKCRICDSTDHLMARCPNKGGKGGTASSSSFAALTDTSTSYLLGNAKRKVQFQFDPPANSPSFPAGTTSGPTPPWESDDQMVMEPPPGYLVLPGHASDGDGTLTHQVFMNFSGQDRLQLEDPWQRWTPSQQYQPPPPSNTAPTLTQRVVGAVAAVGDALRGRSTSPAPRGGSSSPAPDTEAGLYRGPDPWWSNLPGPAAAQTQLFPQQYDFPSMYLPATAQPPPFRPGWSTPPVQPVRELNLQTAPAYQTLQPTASGEAPADRVVSQTATASGTAVGEAGSVMPTGTAVVGNQQAIPAAATLTPTQQQVQNIVDCQNWAQAERRKNPNYRDKQNFAKVIQHHYPPDQFMTKQTACPSEPKIVPTNVYPSSQNLLNDFLTASKFAADIRRNKELPESQRRPISELLPPTTSWSTHGEQASPTQILGGATSVQPTGSAPNGVTPGIPPELQTIINANSSVRSQGAASATSSSQEPMQTPVGSPPQSSAMTGAIAPATYLPPFPQLYNSEASPFRTDAVPEAQYGGYPMPLGCPRVLGPPQTMELTYSSPPEFQGHEPPLQPPTLVTHFEISTPPCIQAGDCCGPHRCSHCQASFVKGDAICRLYDRQCFHQECLEQVLTRYTYEPDREETCELVGTAVGEDENTRPPSEASVDTPSINLSTHVREYAAYPIQTRLQDGRPSIIIDPGSVGNLCGDRWAKEVALMAKAHGQKPTHKLRDRALQVSGVGNGSQQCHYDCDLPLALRPKGQNKLQNGILHVPAVQDSDLPGLMGLTALKSNKAILDFNTLTLYFCQSASYDLDEVLPQGTSKYQLETAPSGHLVLPCCEYKAGSNNEDYSLTLVTKTAQPSTTAGQEKVKGAHEGRPPPPSRSPPSMDTLAPQIPPPPGQPSDSRRERGRPRSRNAHRSRM